MVMISINMANITLLFDISIEIFVLFNNNHNRLHDYRVMLNDLSTYTLAPQCMHAFGVIGHGAVETH